MKTYLQLSAEPHVQSLTLNIYRVERNAALCMQLHHSLFLLLKKTKDK